MSSSPGLSTVAASAVTQRPVKWLWQGRIPFGKISLLDGDPATGKSLLSIEIAASVSVGRGLPGHHGPATAGSVVMIAGEDDARDTIVPRLRAAGADLDKIRIVNAAEDLNLLDAAGEIEKLVVQHSAQLVIIDPLHAYVRGNNMRPALTPLARIGERTGAAFLILRHLVKRARGSAIYAGLGGISVSGIARSALLLGRDVDDPDALILASYKMSIASKPPSLRLAIRPGKAPKIEWLGESDLSADELVAGKRSVDAPNASEEAREFLHALLDQHGGRVRAATAKAEGRRIGIATRSLERVAGEICIAKREIFGGPIFWSARSAMVDGASTPPKDPTSPSGADEEGKVIPLFEPDDDGANPN